VGGGGGGSVLTASGRGQEVAALAALLDFPESSHTCE